MASRPDFQNKREHVMKHVACLFVKFQSWKWAGFIENAHEKRIGDIFKYSCPKGFPRILLYLIKLRFQALCDWYAKEIERFRPSTD